jgi:hypothetical protein
MEILLMAISAGGAFLAAIGALMAARGSHRAANATQNATESQLFSNFLQEYGSPEMNDALSTLSQWKKSYGDDFADVYRKGDKSKPPIKNVSQARRRVKYYYLKAYRLYIRGFVDYEFIDAIADFHGTEILVDIVERLDSAGGKNSESKMYRFYRRIYNKIKNRFNL